MHKSSSRLFGPAISPHSVFSIAAAAALAASLSLPVAQAWAVDGTAPEGDAASVAASSAPEASVSYEGLAMGELFADETLGELVWQQALLRTDAYDPAHAITSDESAAILSCTDLEVEGIAAADVPTCGIEKLTGLEQLNISLPAGDAAEATFALPEGLPNLQTVYLTPAESTEALFVDPAGFSGELGVWSYDAGGANVKSLSFAGCSLDSLFVEDLGSLEELDLSAVAQVRLLEVRDCEGLSDFDFAGKGVEELRLNSLGADFRLSLEGCEQLRLLRLGSMEVPELDLSEVPNLQSFGLQFTNGPRELDLSAQHGLRSIRVWNTGWDGETGENDGDATERVVFADDAPLETVQLSACALAELELPASAASTIERLDVSDNRLASIEVPNASTLTDLDVSGNDLVELVIPEKARASLTSLAVFENRLSAIDLSGMEMEYFMSTSGLTGVGQTATLPAAEQADGSVVVDLSGLSGTLTEVVSQTGSYDKAAGAVTYADVAAAEADTLAYTLDTGGTEEGYSGSGRIPALLEVSATLDVAAYEPPAPTPGEGGEEAGEGGEGSGSESGLDSGEGAFARTGDSTVPAMAAAACAATAAAVAGAAALRARRHRGR